MAHFVLLGTSKGMFTLQGEGDRWQVEGPALRGHVVDAVAIDDRGGRRRLLAGSRSEHWGPALYHSDDAGASWSEPDTGAISFPSDTDTALHRVWQIHPGPHDDGVVFAGVEPAALFRSGDRGGSFELMRGLWDHPTRPEWNPGGGGLGLHSIVIDPANPDRIWVAISAGGVYRTADGGKSWEPCGRGIREAGMPEADGRLYLQCVHKIAAHPERPDVLYAQNHGGVYRTDDAADNWVSIADGLPSDFGFPLVVDPADPDTIYVLPLDSDEFRCTPDGRCRVYRSQDGGSSWEALSNGLPQEHAHLAVLRDGFTSDGATGLAFGTRTGEVFVSPDRGESWTLAVEHLPPVLSVRSVPA